MLRLWSVSLFAGAAFIPLFAAARTEVPQQLHNKTVQLTWTASVVERSTDGQTLRPQLGVSWTVYVSSAGRLFVRASRSTGQQSGHSDMAPGATTTRAGERAAVRFEGSKLVGNIAYSLGAVNFVASFDASFSGCTVRVTYGREGDHIKRRGLDGVTREIESITTSSESCSLRDGNPFAS